MGGDDGKRAGGDAGGERGGDDGKIAGSTAGTSSMNIAVLPALETEIYSYSWVGRGSVKAGRR